MYFSGILERKSIFNKILQEFKNFQQVKAIAIGGSTSAKTFDNKSDIDVYIFKYYSKYEILVRDIKINSLFWFYINLCAFAPRC